MRCYERCLYKYIANMLTYVHEVTTFSVSLKYSLDTQQQHVASI